MSGDVIFEEEENKAMQNTIKILFFILIPLFKISLFLSIFCHFLQKLLFLLGPQ